MGPNCNGLVKPVRAIHNSTAEPSDGGGPAVRLWVFWPLVASAAIVQVLATRIGGPPPSVAIVRNPFAAIAAASVFWRYLVHDAGTARRKRIVYLSPAAVLCGALAMQRGDPAPLPLLDVCVALGALGIGGFLAAIAQAGDVASRDRWTGHLSSALLLPVSASMVSFGLWATSHLNPVYDGRVYLFERQLGISGSLLGVWTYRLLEPFSGVATLCYTTVAIGLAIVAARQATARRESDVLTAAVAAGAVGFGLYFVCPVVGPLQAFAPPYPAALPDLSAVGALITAAAGPPRNGMPSLHTVWALLIWFNAQRLTPAWRRAMGTFAILTIWAAMGLDDTHWLTDVVVAVPFAVAIQAVFVARPLGAARARRDAAWCSAIVAAWLLAITKSGVLANLPAPAAWTAIAASIVWPLSRMRSVHAAHGHDRVAMRERTDLPLYEAEAVS